MDSLREQLQESTSLERSSNLQKKLREENQALMAQNSNLKEANLSLSEEVYQLKQHNQQLTQVPADITHECSVSNFLS